MKAKTVEQKSLKKILKMASPHLNEILDHKVTSIGSYGIYYKNVKPNHIGDIIITTETINGKYFEISIKQKYE